MFGIFKKKAPPPGLPNNFPPVPDWKPAIVQPIDRIVERVRFYTNNTRSFAMFENGTVAILPDELSVDDAEQHAKQALHDVFHAHPDMTPLNMKDGNMLVQYQHGVANLVLADIADQHWSTIDAEHQRALATSEVLHTPLGPNVFDDVGKKALFGRCYMFMDAQSPTVIRIESREG